MRHRKDHRKLGRPTDQRMAMLRSQVDSLFRHEKIKTTVQKAKETQRMAEKLITTAKRGDLHARRQVLRKVRDKDLVAHLFEEIAPRFADRNGGYVRILKIGNRFSDDAPISRVSWVGATLESTEKLRYPDHILELFEEVDEELEAEG